MRPADKPKAPVAFLCHASEDKELASGLAVGLVAAGIDTFFDEWSIRTGDSIRRRIEEGLGSCTHFIVLLTERSIEKAWVNAEIDGAFVQKMAGAVKFLPIRWALTFDQLRTKSPLLAGMHAPEITSPSEGLRQLIADIYGVTQRPPLGERPRFATPPTQESMGLSTAAANIAALMVRESKKGLARDPLFQVSKLLELTELSEEDFQDAIAELEGLSLVEPHRAVGCGPLGFYAVQSTVNLFVQLDQYFMGWNAGQDCVELATALLNSPHHWMNSASAAQQLGWAPRRFNPALAVLIAHEAVDTSNSICADFVSSQFGRNARTRGFVREYS